jgi:hypothetical protein
LDETIVIDKPLSLKGFKGKLKDGVENTAVLIVNSPHVELSRLYLEGNINTIPVESRAPLIQITAGYFVVRDCIFRNGSKDGINVTADGLEEDIINGHIENITGYNNWADVVSISGANKNEGRRIRNILVDHVRCYSSPARGAVEVSDGVEFITVRNVYAEHARYAVDIQDHNYDKQVNRYVSVENVVAKNCEWGVVTRNHDFGHSGLSLRNLSFEDCEKPLDVRNTDVLRIENVHIRKTTGENPPVRIRNCDDVTLRDFAWDESTDPASMFRIQNCSGVKQFLN